MIGTIVTVGIVILAFFIAGAVFGYIGLMALSARRAESVRRAEKRNPPNRNPPNRADATPDCPQGPGGPGDAG